MTARVARRHLKPNKIALGLAVGTSAALGAATVTGYDLDAPEVVGALAVAGTIGVISLHSSRPQRERPQPHVMAPLQSAAAGPKILAPRAHAYVAQSADHSDAA